MCARAGEICAEVVPQAREGPRKVVRKWRTVDFQTQSSSASDHELGPALLHPLLRPDEECEYCSRVDHYLPSFLLT